MNRNLKQYFKQSAVFVFTAMFAVMLSFTFGTKIHAESVAPSDLTQTEETSSSVKISCKSPYDSNHVHHVELSEDKVNWTEVGTTSRSPIVISGLDAGRSYYIHIYHCIPNIQPHFFLW